LLELIAPIALSLAAILAVTSQCRKPRWWLGRLFLWIMNRRHSALTDWAFEQLHIQNDLVVLDLGCGGGRTIQKLSESTAERRVYGVDYSSTSVAVARQVNAGAIEAGRVDVRVASVTQLPFQDATFDLATGVETHYYWPSLATDMREVLRVLKPGGRLAIIAESYRGGRFGILSGQAMKLLRAAYLTASAHRDLFLKAGYSDIAMFEQRDKGWLCVVGRRPR